MHVSNTLAAGIAAAAIPLTAALPEASAGTIYTQSNLVDHLDDTQFVTLRDGDYHRPPTALLTWGTGVSLRAGIDQHDAPIADPPDFDSYALIGLDSAGGVVVTFADPSLAVGRPFEAVFPGFSEPQVADAILTGGPLLDSFIAQLGVTPGVSTPTHVDCYCVHFSTGAIYGTFIADTSPVPGPGAGMVLSIAGASSLRRRRRSPA